MSAVPGNAEALKERLTNVAAVVEAEAARLDALFPPPSPEQRASFVLEECWLSGTREQLGRSASRN